MTDTITYRGRTWVVLQHIDDKDGNRYLLEWHGAKKPTKTGGWYCDYAIRWVPATEVRYIGGAGFYESK